MNASRFTPRQRRIVLLMVLAVMMVFAMLAGFIVTSLQDWERAASDPTPSLASVLSTPSLPPTLSSAPSPTPGEGIQSQVQAARLFDQIAYQVETKRELSPRAEVPLSFLDEEEMMAMLRRIHTERGPQARLNPYVALGLLPDAPISIRTHQGTGLYVPEQEQLYVSTDQPENSADTQALLAHAYVHALQDQHFDLEAMGERATTVDAQLAVQGLIEGDATLSTAFYRYEDVDRADWEQLTELIVQAEQPDYGEELEQNRAWSRLKRFPNHQGRQFAQTLFQSGGWEAINRAYTTPPRSTEHVLHPERYLENSAPPATVVVPDLRAVLGEDWTLLLQETLGEFVAGLYLEGGLPEMTAWGAVDGWDGDTFVVWERENGNRMMVWRTIWDSTEEAVEFERALAALIQERYLPARPIDPPPNMRGQWWETRAGAMHVHRLARYVLFVHAPDVNTLANVVEVLP